MRPAAALWSPAPVSITDPRAWRLSGLVVPVAFIAALAVHVFVLERFANSGDEFSYVWQATAFSEGRVTAPPPEPREAFHANHITDVEDRRFSKYPPGWPLLLALGVLVGLPGAVNPLLGALALAGIHRLGCTWISPRAATLGTAAVGASPFFLLNAGSFHSHPSCLFALSGLALSLAWARERPGAVPLALAGASFGLAVLIRPYTALLLAVPLLGAYAAETWRERRVVARLVAFGLGGLPLAAFLAVVNTAVSGHWWALAWSQYDASEAIGFGVYGHTLFQGIKTAIRLCAEGVLYTSFMGAALVAAAIGRDIARKRLLWILLAAPIVGYVFWWSHGGNRYGPRFYFEALLPFTLLAGAGAERLAGEARARMVAASAAMVALVTLVVLSMAAHRQVDARRDVYRTVEAARISNAVVFLETASADMVRFDLTRNLPSFARANVIYALSRHEGNDAVERAFPDRAFYTYRWSPAGGTLQPFAAGDTRDR